MKKCFWIIPCICFILVCLIAVIVFTFPHFGINFDFFNGKKPIDMGEAIWYSEDGESWFQVKDSNICLGELCFKEKKIPVYYVFEHFDRISIYSKTDSKIYVSNDDFSLDEEATVFYGICKFKKNKMSVEISCEDNTEYIEKITFNQSGDGSLIDN